jgi:hypothetical protein
MMKPLLNKISPNKDESLYSYIFRLAIANYFEHLGSMFKHLGSTAYYSNINYLEAGFKHYPFLDEFMKIHYQNVHQFILNKYNHILVANNNGGTSGRLQDQRVYTRLNTKYCPLCLKEDFYHRLYWDISLLTICQKHQVYLIEECINCKQNIRLSRLMRNECTCGFKYTEGKIKEPPHEIIMPQEIIYSLVNGGTEVIKHTFEKELSRDEFFQLFFLFCHLIDGLGTSYFSYHKYISTVNKLNFDLKQKEKRSVEMMSYIILMAFELVISPEKELPKVFNVIENTHYKKAEYMTKYRYFKKIVNHPYGEIYHKVYSDYLDNRKDIYINRFKMITPRISKKQYLTILETVKIMKSEYSAVMNLCKHGILKLYRSEKNNKVYTLIERKSVEEYLNMKKNSLSFSKTQNYLGVSVRTLQDLVDKKLLVPTHGPGFDGYELWYFEEKHVEQLLYKFGNQCINLQSKTEDYWLPIKDAVMKLRYLNVGTTDLLILLLNGEIEAACVSPLFSIKDLKVSKESILRIKLNDIQERIIARGYKSKEVEKIFNISLKTVEKWIKDGILKVSDNQNNKNDTVTRFFDKDQLIKLLINIKGYDYSNAIKHLETVILKQINK